MQVGKTTTELVQPLGGSNHWRKHDEALLWAELETKKNSPKREDPQKTHLRGDICGRKRWSKGKSPINSRLFEDARGWWRTYRPVGQVVKEREREMGEGEEGPESCFARERVRVAFAK